MSQSNSQKFVSIYMEAGTHWLCSCGLSQNFPYCDGAHKSTAQQPIALELESPKVVEIAR